MLAGTVLKYMGLLFILGSFGAYFGLVSTMPGDPGRKPFFAFQFAAAIFFWGFATVLAGLGIQRKQSWGYYIAFILSLVWTIAHAYSIFFRKLTQDAHKPLIALVFLVETAFLFYFFRKARLAFLNKLP